MKFLGMLLHADNKSVCGYVLVDDFWNAPERLKNTEMCGTKHKWWVTGPDADFDLQCCGHSGDADCHVQCRQSNSPFWSFWSTKTTIHELKVISLGLAKVLAEDDAEVRRVLGWRGDSRVGRKWDYTQDLNR